MYTASLSATGLVRVQNEDVIFVTTDPIGPLPNLFIVADGMGGHNAGEVASQKSIEFACQFLQNVPQQAHPLTPDSICYLLVQAAIQANNDVYNMASANPTLSGMGTTFSACVVHEDMLIVAHIGDSRIYFINGKDISQVTTDHTYVEEMVSIGNITREEAKHHPKRSQITRALGFESSVIADGTTHSLKGVEFVLLCSDGLTDMLSDKEILALITANAGLQQKVQALVDGANNQGGKDNISAIIIDVKGEIH